VDQQEDLWIKVPGPFYGVGTVGFSVRYSQEPELPEPATVTFFVEGEAAPLEALAHSLRLFPERERFVDCEAPGEAYGWSDPINLSDEVIVMAFKDRSLAGTRLRRCAIDSATRWCRWPSPSYATA
jgi:hypothetical protein